MNRFFILLAAVAAFTFTCAVSLQAEVVSEYQWTSGGSDWFADPSQAPFSGLPAEVSLNRYSDITNNSGIRNYASNALLTNGITADGGFPIAINGYLGPGLNFMVQNSGEDFEGIGLPDNGTNFRLRQQRGRFNVRNRDQSNGMTMFAWSSSAPTTLADLDFALAIGPAGQAPPLYQDGLRFAIQDAGNQWHLSNWSSNGKIPVGGTDPPVTGTATGVHVVDLDNQTWAPYTPASLSSNSLALFDSGSATFASFGGSVKAFGFFAQHNGGDTAFRINGFRVVSNPVVIPEPSSALALCAGGIFAAGIRRRLT